MEAEKPMVFIASPDDKREAEIIISQIIHLLKNKNVGFKAYTLQHLIESFEDVYKIDLRKSVSINQL